MWKEKRIVFLCITQTLGVQIHPYPSGSRDTIEDWCSRHRDEGFGLYPDFPMFVGLPNLLIETVLLDRTHWRIGYSRNFQCTLH